jgi:hypothetical protein
MKNPLPVGTDIDQIRFDQWMATFSGYVSQVTQRKIELWLDQFSEGDKDLAARMLDAVLYIGSLQIMTLYRGLLRGLDGWDDDPEQRTGRWFFVAFSRSSGESGDTMVHRFRMATGMTKKKFDPLFIHRSELVSAKLTPEDTVVLIDDFSGSGGQATTAWAEVFEELLYGEPRTYLLLVAATETAINAVRNETDMELICGTVLHGQQDFFDASCKCFSEAEKASILKYCKKANSKEPRGWDNSGLLVVFEHRCPNNTLPIFHVSNAKWIGLFPRNFD